MFIGAVPNEKLPKENIQVTFALSRETNLGEHRGSGVIWIPQSWSDLFLNARTSLISLSRLCNLLSILFRLRDAIMASWDPDLSNSKDTNNA